jgi:anthranilate/para-aminobenzoate synthase component I
VNPTRVAGTRSNEGKDGERHKLRRDLTSHPKDIFEHAIFCQGGRSLMKQSSHPETVAVPFYVKTWMRNTHVLLVNDLAIEFTQSMFQK